MNPFAKLHTKHNYIIIVGCGRLGSYLADMLSQRGDEVLIVDKAESSFQRLPKTFSGDTVEGDAVELLLKGKCGIKGATAVIAVTNRDNTNIMVSQIAKEMFHVEKVIARLYDPDRECVYSELGIDTICPVILSAGIVEKMMYEQESQVDVNGL